MRLFCWTLRLFLLLFFHLWVVLYALEFRHLGIEIELGSQPFSRIMDRFFMPNFSQQRVDKLWDHFRQFDEYLQKELVYEAQNFLANEMHLLNDKLSFDRMRQYTSFLLSLPVEHQRGVVQSFIYIREADLLQYRHADDFYKQYEWLQESAYNANNGEDFAIEFRLKRKLSRSQEVFRRLDELVYSAGVSQEVRQPSLDARVPIHLHISYRGPINPEQFFHLVTEYKKLLAIRLMVKHPSFARLFSGENAAISYMQDVSIGGMVRVVDADKKHLEIRVLYDEPAVVFEEINRLFIGNYRVSMLRIKQEIYRFLTPAFLAETEKRAPVLLVALRGFIPEETHVRAYIKALKETASLSKTDLPIAEMVPHLFANLMRLHPPRHPLILRDMVELILPDIHTLLSHFLFESLFVHYTTSQNLPFDNEILESFNRLADLLKNGKASHLQLDYDAQQRWLKKTNQIIWIMQSTANPCNRLHADS